MFYANNSTAKQQSLTKHFFHANHSSKQGFRAAFLQSVSFLLRLHIFHNKLFIYY